MAENQPFSFADSIGEARQRLALELRAQAEQIQKLNLELTELQMLQERTELEASRQWDAVANSAELAAAALKPQVPPDTVLENVLGAVRGLMTCTIPEQVIEALAEEAAEWGVRAAIFDVRGKSAWGASARGFGPALTDYAFRSLIVQLGQDNPFRQVCETAGDVMASAEALKKNRNVLEKLKPAPHAPVLLLPIRSAGTVTAIFYADPGESEEALPVNALKILAEFAGAQIDRLIALSGGFAEGTAADTAPSAAESDSRSAAGHAESPLEATAPEESHPEQFAAASALAEVPAVEGNAAGQRVETDGVAVQAQTEVLEPPAPQLEPEPVAAIPEAPVQAPEPVADIGEVFLQAPEPAPEIILEFPPEPNGLPQEPVPSSTEISLEFPPPEAAPQEAAPSFAEPSAEAPVSDFLIAQNEIAVPSAEHAANFTEATSVSKPPDPVFVDESIAQAAPPVPAAFDVSQLSDADQKVHKDARRFAKLLVSEIELYNKAKVAEGRKNWDLYKRLKSDIDRSRQTFEKRFGKDLSRQVDYFHDELVKILAANAPAILGPEYPGPCA